MAPPFAASTDFAIDKPAGHPCPNLSGDHRCTIHDALRARGFPGCAAYDCFGAGQQVAQVTCAGTDWRSDPVAGRRMFDVFAVMRRLHQMLWYLAEALELEEAAALQPELLAAAEETGRMTALPADAVLGLDAEEHRDAVDALLERASRLARSAAGGEPRDLRGARLIEADLTATPLRGADLRGAVLLGATMVGADLALADLIGADLRAADLSGADLSHSIFLTQAQIAAARGNNATRIPPALTRPAYWPV